MGFTLAVTLILSFLLRSEAQITRGPAYQRRLDEGEGAAITFHSKGLLANHNDEATLNFECVDTLTTGLVQSIRISGAPNSAFNGCFWVDPNVHGVHAEGYPGFSKKRGGHYRSTLFYAPKETEYIFQANVPVAAWIMEERQEYSPRVALGRSCYALDPAEEWDHPSKIPADAWWCEAAATDGVEPGEVEEAGSTVTGMHVTCGCTGCLPASGVLTDSVLVSGADIEEMNGCYTYDPATPSNVLGYTLFRKVDDSVILQYDLGVYIVDGLAMPTWSLTFADNSSTCFKYDGALEHDHPVDILSSVARGDIEASRQWNCYDAEAGVFSVESDEPITITCGCFGV